MGEDRKQRRDEEEKPTDIALSPLRRRNIRFLSTADWRRLDAREMAQGRRLGRGHLKCLSLPEALDALDEKDSVAEIDSQVQAIDADNFHTILGVCPIRHRRTV